jgi:hypothetical protein
VKLSPFISLLIAIGFCIDSRMSMVALIRIIFNHAEYTEKTITGRAESFGIFLMLLANLKLQFAD